jgi:hypothetical protein
VQIFSKIPNECTEGGFNQNSKIEKSEGRSIVSFCLFRLTRYANLSLSLADSFLLPLCKWVPVPYNLIAALH